MSIQEQEHNLVRFKSSRFTTNGGWTNPKALQRTSYRRLLWISLPLANLVNAAAVIRRRQKSLDEDDCTVDADELNKSLHLNRIGLVDSFGASSLCTVVRGVV